MYGFTIVDYTKNQTIHVHCTYNESESLNSQYWHRGTVSVHVKSKWFN